MALRAHRERQEADRTSVGYDWDEDGYLFAKLDGPPLLPDSVSHGIMRLARKAGLAGVNLRDLRHTHSSLMLKQGVHPKIVQERLGHASISTTMDIYSHVLPSMQDEAAMAFGRPHREQGDGQTDGQSG